MCVCRTLSLCPPGAFCKPLDAITNILTPRCRKRMVRSAIKARDTLPRGDPSGRRRRAALRAGWHPHTQRFHLPSRLWVPTRGPVAERSQRPVFPRCCGPVRAVPGRGPAPLAPRGCHRCPLTLRAAPRRRGRAGGNLPRSPQGPGSFPTRVPPRRCRPAPPGPRRSGNDLSAEAASGRSRVNAVPRTGCFSGHMRQRGRRRGWDR